MPGPHLDPAVPHLRVVFILGHPTRTRGGLEIAAHAFGRELARRGHSIVGFFRHRGELLSDYESFCDSVVVLDSVRGLVRAIRITASLLRASHVVVYGHQTGWIPAMWLLSILTRSSLACHLHLAPPERLGAVTRWCLGRVDVFLAVSRATAEAWERGGYIDPDRVSVVHNGIDVEGFRPGADLADARRRHLLPSTGRVVAFIGRLDRIKGVDVLIRAFSRYATSHPDRDVHLVIAGSPLIDGDDYADELRDLARAVDGDRVHFVGRIDDPVSFYQAADLVVLPARWFEPFGLTLVEAMACGVPTVASRVGGIPEVLADFPDHLFDEEDDIRLTHLIAELVDWRDSQPGLGAASRQSVIDRFSLDGCIDGVERALRSTQSQEARPRGARDDRDRSEG